MACFFFAVVEPGPLIQRQNIGLLYQPCMIDDDDDCGVIGEINDWRRKEEYWKKHAPVPLWPAQTPHMTNPGLEPRPLR
jgi:hypothetical protein